MNFILSNKNGGGLGRSPFSCASEERLYPAHDAGCRHPSLGCSTPEKCATGGRHGGQEHDAERPTLLFPFPGTHSAIPTQVGRLRSMHQFLSIFWSVSASDLFQHLPASTSRPDKSGSSVLPCARAATL